MHLIQAPHIHGISGAAAHPSFPSGPLRGAAAIKFFLQKTIHWFFKRVSFLFTYFIFVGWKLCQAHRSKFKIVIGCYRFFLFLQYITPWGNRYIYIKVAIYQFSSSFHFRTLNFVFHMYIMFLYRICFSIFKPVFIRQRVHRVVSRRAARGARAARAVGEAAN